jgi:hypothetical protein
MRSNKIICDSIKEFRNEQETPEFKERLLRVLKYTQKCFSCKSYLARSFNYFKCGHMICDKCVWGEDFNFDIIHAGVTKKEGTIPCVRESISRTGQLRCDTCKYSEVFTRVIRRDNKILISVDVDLSWEFYHMHIDAYTVESFMGGATDINTGEFYSKSAFFDGYDYLAQENKRLKQRFDEMKAQNEMLLTRIEKLEKKY